MAKFGQGIESLNKILEDENTTVSVEVEATAETIENAEGTAEAEVELDEAVDASDAAAEEGETVEALAETVAEEGYTPALAKFCDKMGITTALNAHMGFAAIVGAESLSATGSNEEQAKLVLAACEGWMKDTKDKIVKFFKELWEKIKRMFEWVVQKFRSYETTIKKLVDKMKGKSLDTEKAKNKKVKLYTDASCTILSDMAKNIQSSVVKTLDGKTGLVDTSEADLEKIEKLETKEFTVLEAGTVDVTVVLDRLKGVANMRSVETQFKGLIQKADGIAKHTERSGDDSKAEKDELKVLRENASKAAKMVKVAIGATNKLATNWIKWANAWLACAK